MLGKSKKKKSERATAPVDAKIQRSIKAVKPVESNEEIVKIPSNPYTNMVGSFGTMTKKADKVTGVSWEGCRDRFQNHSEPAAYQEFLFCHRPKCGDNVIDFIHTVEEIIRLKPEDRVTLKKTSNPNIIYVCFSPWWKYRMRRSLLTALLRCGQEYKERTAECFEKALFSQYYTAQTKPAVVEFLKGRTASKLKRRNGFSGWYQLFANKKTEDARQFLVRLKPKPPEEEGKPAEGSDLAWGVALHAKPVEGETTTPT